MLRFVFLASSGVAKVQIATKGSVRDTNWNMTYIFNAVCCLLDLLHSDQGKKKKQAGFTEKGSNYCFSIENSRWQHLHLSRHWVNDSQQLMLLNVTLYAWMSTYIFARVPFPKNAAHVAAHFSGGGMGMHKLAVALELIYFFMNWCECSFFT